MKFFLRLLKLLMLGSQTFEQHPLLLIYFTAAELIATLSAPLSRALVTSFIFFKPPVTV